MPRLGLSFNALILSILLAMPAAAEQQGFRWQQDIESAKALAKQSGRLVLVHFWSPNCGPCVALEHTVFNQPGVAGAVETYYVPVRLNAEEHAATAQQFGVSRIPTDVVLTADGNMVGKMVSPPTPAAYVSELKQVATRMGAKPAPYTSAAAEAPQPANINEAYAHLDLGKTPTPPASSPFQGSPSDPYAQSQFLSIPTVSQAASAATAASEPITGYTPAAYQQPVPAASTAAIGSSPATANNPYAPTQPAGGYATAPTAGQPNRIENPYTFAAPPIPTVATSEPITKYTQPAAAAPTAAPAPPVVAAASTTNPVPPAAPAAPPITPIAAEPPQVAANATGTVATPDGRVLPAGAPPLGFEGYSPVAMRKTWKWVPGDPQWGAIHRGRTYWFTSQAEQQEFLANPDYFGPALSGIDPVLAIDHRQAVPGKREHSIDYENQFYLFSSEATLQQFTSNPGRYATGVRQAMGIGPQQTTVR